MHICTFLFKEETNPMHSSHLRLNTIEVLQLKCLFSSKNTARGCFKQWCKHHSMQIVMIVINNRNYNFKGIIDNYDFCHNRAALI